MKLKLFSALLATASINVMAQDMETSIYEKKMKDIENFCPSCKKSLESMMNSLSRNCGFPKTIENIMHLSNTHPMYGASLAMITKLDTDIEKDAIYKAITDSGSEDSCWNASLWITSFEKHIDSELWNKILIK